MGVFESYSKQILTQMKAKDLVFRLLKAFYFQKFNHQYFKNGGEKSITSYLGSERLVFYLFSIRLKEKIFEDLL